MLTLRLSRVGTKKRPVYHLVATDSRARRDGRFVENLGYYVPNRQVLVLKQDRIEHWLARGAQVSETAKHLISRVRVKGNQVPEPKRKVAPPPPKKKSEAPKPETKVETKVEAATEPNGRKLSEENAATRP